MRLLTVRSYPRGRRVWVGGQRLHHGATGCALMALSLLSRRARPLALAGVLLAAHDRRDVRVWFKREALPLLAGVTLDSAADPQ